MSPPTEPRPRAPEVGPAAADPVALRVNFIALWVHGMFGQTGFRLLQAPTFLPTYITLLFGSDAAAGLARAVQSFGLFLSPLVGAPLVEHRARLKRTVLWTGTVMRLQFLLLGLLCLLAPNSVSRVAIWFILAAWGLSSGLQAVVFNLLLSKLVPIAQRGRFHGWRNLTSSFVLFFVSGAAGWMIEAYGFPRGYGWGFLLAFVLTSLGLQAVAYVREPASADLRAPEPLLLRLRGLPALLRAEPEFARFVRINLLATAARGALPYYILELGGRIDLPGRHLGALTIAFSLAQGVSAVLWGTLGDRSGYKRVLRWSLLCWLAANAIALTRPSLALAYLLFVLVGAGWNGLVLTGGNMVLEFGGERDRAKRIAATNAQSEAVGMAGFLGAALLSGVGPMALIFVASFVLQAAALWVSRRLHEPRKDALPSG